MRILALCPYVPFPPTHGGRIRSGVVVGALAAEHEVEVACPVGVDEFADAEACREGLGLAAPIHALPVSMAVPAAPFRKVSRWMRGRSDVLWRRWSRAARRQVRDLVGGSGGYDVLLVDGTFAWPIVPRGFAGKKVLALHNLEAEVLARLARGLPGRVEASVLARVEARAANQCEATIVVSERERAALARVAPRASISVIPNTVDLGRLQQLPPRPSTETPRLLFVGSFDYPPNREAAERILTHDAPLLRSVWPGLRIRLVGKDPSGELRRRAGHVDGVEMAGFVEDLREEYAQADAVYVPLMSGGGTRIKVLEAMALGRPILATTQAVEGLGLVPGTHYLDCTTAERGVASVRAVVAEARSASLTLVAAARSKVATEFGDEDAARRVVGLMASLASSPPMSERD